MFGHRYFGVFYFGPEYFGPGVNEGGGGGEELDQTGPIWVHGRGLGKCGLR